MKFRLAIGLALICALSANAGGKRHRKRPKRTQNEFARHAGTQGASAAVFHFLTPKPPSELPTPPPANVGPSPELLEGPVVEIEEE